VLEKPVKMRIPAGFRWLAALTLAAQFLVVTLKYQGGTSELSTRDPFWEFKTLLSERSECLYHLGRQLTIF